MKALVIASLLAASLGARMPVRFAKAADTALCSGGSLSYETYYLSPGATTVKDCTLNGVEFYLPSGGSGGRAALRVEGGTSNGGIEIDVRAGAPVDIAIRGVHFVDSTLEIQGMILPAGSSITVRDCTYDLNGYWEANELYFGTVLNSKITFANNVLNTNYENGYTIALYMDGYNSYATTFIDSEVVFEKNRMEANVTTGSVARGLYMEDVYGSGLAVNFRDNAIASGAGSYYGYYSYGLYLYRDYYCSGCLDGKITVKATGNTFDGVRGYLDVEDDAGNTDVTFRDNEVTCNPDYESYGEIEVEHYYAAITDPLRIDVGNNVFDNCQYSTLYIDAPVLPDGSALTVTGNLFTPKAADAYEAVFFSSETIDFTSKSVITISNNELRTDVEGYTAMMFGFYLDDAPLSAEDRAKYGSIGMCSNKYLGTVYPIENLTDYVYLEDDSEAFFSSQCLTMHYSAAPAGRAALTVAAATLAAMAAAFVAAVV